MHQETIKINELANEFYLKRDGIKLLLSQIDQSNRNGHRDYSMLTPMYTTRIIVSELLEKASLQ